MNQVSKCLFFMLASISLLPSNSARAEKVAAARTEVRITKAQGAKFKDLSASLQMASITPLINSKDEAICMSIGTIHDKVISQVLKAEEGDCFSDVKIYKKTSGGKLTSEVVSVLSPSDAMMLYQELVGASRVDVDLKRKKKVVPMTYLID